MADVQAQFAEFDAAIRLGPYDENETLRQKRDAVRKKLDANLPAVFRKYGESVPGWRWYDQGSYDLGTGIKPADDGDYDIDQGLYFEIAASAYPNPVLLKQRVHEALEGHTKSVSIRRSCVTVQYVSSGEPLYHVDVAVISDASQNSDRKNRLAFGKASSGTQEREWRVSDTDGLKKKFWDRFAKGPDRDQFRREIRYLKRWKDFNFDLSGSGAPTGIALTVGAYQHLSPRYADVLTKESPRDVVALHAVVTALLGQFGDVWDATEKKFIRRLKIALPVEPWSDLLEKLTPAQMGKLEEKLGQLRDALVTASSETDPVEACKALRKVFGPDFPVPERKETAKKHAPAISTSSVSA